MSVLAVHPFDHVHTKDTHTLITIGAQHSYYFYQQLNTQSKTSLQQSKQIIPSIPRQHFKVSKNSSLSPIRSQKVMPKDTASPLHKQALIPKRPYPLIATFSSPATLQSTTKKRQRKVSFDDKVVVVCTIFDEDADEQAKDEIRRHSTGETQPKSILITPSSSSSSSPTPMAQKITRSLKQFKNRLLFV